MKKFGKLMSVILSLALCVGMIAPAFAASFDDLQAAINGDSGTPIEGSDYTDHYGYGDKNDEGNYGVESWKDGDTTNVQLNEDVVHTDDDKTDTITVEGNVNLDLNDNNIIGDGEHDVISVEEDGSLTVNGGTDEAEEPADEPASEADEPKNTIGGGSAGINVSGSLTLDGVTVSGNDVGVNVEAGGKAEIEDSTIVNNDVGVAFVDDSSVTFVGDGNVVNQNKTNIAGNGKVEFKLGDNTYEVDAETAETLLADKESIAANGTDWILVKNGGESDKVIYTGTGDNGNRLTQSIVESILIAVSQEGGNGPFDFIVSNGVEKLEGAFRNRTDIKGVTLPNSVTYIGRYSFQGCSSLVGTIELPASIETIDYMAFENCASLTGVKFAEGKDDQNVSIAINAFRDCTSLEQVIMPAGLKKLEQGTFSGCESLENVVVPGVTTVGFQAFGNCTALKTIELSAEAKTIADYAFDGCSNLAIDLTGWKFESIGNAAFNGCSQITGTVEIPASMTEIGRWAFKGCANLTDVKFNSGLTVIGEGAFKGCAKLETVDLPSNLTKISNEAFSGCSGLIGKIAIPANVERIDYHAFDGCISIASVDLTNASRLESIGEGAFSGCSNLQEVIFAENSSLNLIGNGAFSGCGNLHKVMTLPEGVETIGRWGVFGGNVTMLVFPSTLKTTFPNMAGNIKSAVLYAAEDMSADSITTAVAAMMNARSETNVYVISDNEDLSFYRGVVSADFGHNGTDGKIDEINGSIELTNASGTITVGDDVATLPNVAGVTVSIDTNGNITVNAPITVGETDCPYGAVISPDGTVEALPEPPAPPVIPDGDVTIGDVDVPMGETPDDPNEVEIDDEDVPLASGPVTRAQFIDYLWRHEGQPESAACTFTDVSEDHEYALALGWAEANGVASAFEDGSFRPDDLVTVAAVREFLGSFAKVFGMDMPQLTTLAGGDGEAVLNCAEVLAEFFGEELPSEENAA